MRRHDRRSASERRVRAAWRGEAGPALRLGSLLFGLAADARNLAYESGIAVPAAAPVPVLSVGGLTVGGSGKTPVAAAAARALLGRDVRTAVVTRGFADELAVHRRLNPGALVLGAPDRRRAVDRAASRGAGAAVLDDGFQHRRLGRDLEWTVVSAVELQRRGWSRLPAGPARDRWGELARSDAVIVTSREGGGPGGESPTGRGTGFGGGRGPGGGSDGPVAALRKQFPASAVAACRFRPSGLRAANAAAEAADRPEPRVAFASVMRGEEFLSRRAEELGSVEHTYLFPDHHSLDDRVAAEMAGAAGRGGILGTLKDAVKLAGRLDPGVPLWFVSEEVVWTEGADRLSTQLDHLARLAPGPGRSRRSGRP